MKINSTNNNMDLVSIITPTYNSEKYIKETISSVLSQTYQNWEMIIVDDCSTDNTVRIIEEEMEKNSRIRFIQLQENQGAAVARNTAINYANGRYIAFLDSDNLWEMNKLEVQVSFLNMNNIPFSYTSYKIINENGEETGKVVNVPEKIDYNQLLKNTIIGCLTVMLDINEFGRVQMPNMRTRQDTALWLSILKQGYIAYGIQQPLAKYRKKSGSISSNKLKMAKQNWKLYREIENLSLVKSIWCFLNYAYNGIKKNL